jgi:hypothetical protein
MDTLIKIAKVDFGTRFDSFEPRNINLIACCGGKLGPVEHGVAKTRCSHTASRERAAAIVASGEYHVLPMGGPPNQRCRIIWRTDGSVKTPVDGFPYVPVPGEEPVPDDLPDLAPESENEQDQIESEPTPLAISKDPRWTAFYQRFWGTSILGAVAGGG